MLRGLVVAAILMGPAMAEAKGAQPSALVTVEMRDGSRLVGRIVAEDAGSLQVRTREGLEVEVARASVVSVREVSLLGNGRRHDPNYSRLMFAPTGRPLRKGDGYFSDYELVFPGVAYGLTDHLSLAGGLSVIPGLGMGEQLFYVSPKLGWELSERVSVAVGGLFATAGDDDLGGLGIAFAVGTFGSRQRSLSAGLGLARELEDGYAETRPILMLGGQVQLSDSIALVSENWLVLDRDVRLSEQPFGLALRFFGDRLSADVGVILVGELLDEGFPLPWLSFTYHFSGRRGSSR